MGKASRAKRVRREHTNLWHFTSEYHLPSILDEGFIRTTESNLDFRAPDAGPRVVWLLDTPEADSHEHGLSYSAVDKRAVRIEVRTKAERWTEWVKRQPAAHRATIEAMVSTGGGMEAARHWYVAEQPIPRSEWVNVRLR